MIARGCGVAPGGRCVVVVRPRVVFPELQATTKAGHGGAKVGLGDDTVTWQRRTKI
jgi:hypothetical protein